MAGLGIEQGFPGRRIRGNLHRGTYVTPGLGDSPTGYEGAAVQVAGGPCYLSALYVYLSNSAPAARWIQVFNAIGPTPGNGNASTGDVPGVNGAAPWNPRFIGQLNPGQTLTWEPASEYQQQQVEYGEVLGHPFSTGILVVASTNDAGFTAPTVQGGGLPACLRITARVAFDPIEIFVGGACVTAPQPNG